jgi:protein-L-isoaspartate(D-aspartate) O-methyltransferase
MISSTAARQHMILGQLYTNDIVDKRILEAMNDIAREPFLPEILRGAAYVDEDLDVGNGRYLMEPLIFAKLLDLAAITPSCRVLTIGCLSGYSAAILSKLASHVVAVDSDPAAIAQAHEHMKRLGITNVNLQVVKTMADGYALSAPYNAIVIQGAIDFISEALGSQLAVGGRLVAVRNIARRVDIKGGLGKGLLVTRLDHKLQYREHFDASCPLLPGFEQAASFVF